MVKTDAIKFKICDRLCSELSLIPDEKLCKKIKFNELVFTSEKDLNETVFFFIF